VLRRLLRSPRFWLGGALVAVLVLVALLAPLLAPHSPQAIQLAWRLSPPGVHGFALGSDTFGRDVLSRVLYGARISLTVGLLSVALAAVTGVLLGATAGFFGGWADLVLVRVIDVLLSFPVILLAMLMVATIGPGLGQMIFAVALANMPRFARVARASAKGLAATEFVTAAEAQGGGRWFILFRHVIPNLLATVLVLASLSVGSAMLTEAGLSFLGLGVPPPAPTWGGIVHDGTQVLDHAPWIALGGGLPILLAVLGFNLLGDALRDTLDPKLEGR
jgi:peptide/nickel transport system permease protein